MNCARVSFITLRSTGIFGVGCVWIVILVFWLTGVSNAQVVTKIDADRPSVYLKYSGRSLKVSHCARKPVEHILLELHNNTNSPINIGAEFSVGSERSSEEQKYALPGGLFGKVLGNGTNVDVCYDVMGTYQRQGTDFAYKTEVKIEPTLLCRCSYREDSRRVVLPDDIGFWIAPGGHVKFGVPSNILRKETKVYTDYSYAWEFGNSDLEKTGPSRLGYNEPRHHVYFYFTDLPKGK